MKLIKSVEKVRGYCMMTVPVFGGVELTPELVRERLIDRGVKLIFYRTDSVILNFGAKDAMRLRSHTSG